MNFAVSNIAWENHDDLAILNMLKEQRVKGIEVAPTKVWPQWEGASFEEAKKYQQKMENLGFAIPAMQAILFGQNELQLFDQSSHQKFFDHFKLVGELAQGFGCKVLVFGSPKNRQRGTLPLAEAEKMAIDFFNRAGEICQSYQCSIGLEPCPPQYNCDFICNVPEAKDLVAKVNHRAFNLHLDTGAIHLNGEDLVQTIEGADFIHYHISEPELAPIHGGAVEQEKGIGALRKKNYTGWVSIEMKQPSSTDIFLQSLRKIKNIIGEKV